MKPTTIALALLLSACTHNVALLPRAGGQQAVGSYNDGSKTMTVTLDGKTYAGDYVRGRSAGVAIGASGAVTPGIGISNAHSALLTGPDGNVRCEWVREAFAGNGVCQDPQGRIFDLQIK